MIDQSGGESVGDLEIGGNCWIGAKAVVTDGACIGENSVIGAGAVVVKPIPRNSVAVGIPAKVIRTIEKAETSDEGAR